MEKWLGCALDYIPRWIEFQARMHIARCGRAPERWAHPFALRSPIATGRRSRDRFGSS